ncbi:antibiotic biosynthesis monooxygenase [Frankia sp. AgPm24]|uniref:Antibiotic biosynthesis monooxygenase n=1 Tax=Frankia umida TaxID=573489 RepID=A0ABT0JYN9_9ACTN|nr:MULTISPECIES: putative quinol monooxygenase [Frankia]MCK9876658.1 antibiotic biosynthesis monooxygenase [Frankia umida]MCK9924925.1 antibiotic biosynthesis monooxygenase [Frankia sp. AgPm24]
MSVVVVAVLKPLPERRAQVRAAFEAAFPLVHEQDAGCELYALHESDDEFVIVEKWTSEDLLDEHGTSPAMKTLVSGLDGGLAEAPVIRRLRAIPLGTASQGQL